MLSGPTDFCIFKRLIVFSSSFTSGGAMKIDEYTQIKQLIIIRIKRICQTIEKLLLNFSQITS